MRGPAGGGKSIGGEPALASARKRWQSQAHRSERGRRQGSFTAGSSEAAVKEHDGAKGGVHCDSGMTWCIPSPSGNKLRKLETASCPSSSVAGTTHVGKGAAVPRAPEHKAVACRDSLNA